MKVAVFSAKSYDRQSLESVNRDYGHELVYFSPNLEIETAKLAAGFTGICVFVNDTLDAETLRAIASKISGSKSENDIKLIALRCTGFNNVDLTVAKELGITVVRVPAYSPYAVAEHAVGLILTLNRKFHRAYARVREGNFSLDGLLGFDLHDRTVGIIGTGRIGMIAAQILHGFGCHILAYDKFPNPACEAIASYVSLFELFSKSDIISLHCPLTPETHHLINSEAIAQMKHGVMLINTSRGALIDTKAVIKALKSGKVGYLGLDVYEQEADLFFEDLSNTVIQDDVFQRLLTFPNVIITGHQAFFTEDALRNIAQTTLQNITDFENGNPCPNTVNLPS